MPSFRGGRSTVPQDCGKPEVQFFFEVTAPGLPVTQWQLPVNVSLYMGGRVNRIDGSTLTCADALGKVLLLLLLRHVA